MPRESDGPAQVVRDRCFGAKHLRVGRTDREWSSINRAYTRITTKPPRLEATAPKVDPRKRQSSTSPLISLLAPLGSRRSSSWRRDHGYAQEHGQLPLLPPTDQARRTDDQGV